MTNESLQQNVRSIQREYAERGDLCLYVCILILSYAYTLQTLFYGTPSQCIINADQWADKPHLYGHLLAL